MFFGISGSHSGEHGECRQDYVWASGWYVIWYLANGPHSITSHNTVIMNVWH